MKSAIQFHSNQFKLIEEDTYATTDDFQRLFAREMTDLFRLSLHLTADAENSGKLSHPCHEGVLCQQHRFKGMGTYLGSPDSDPQCDPIGFRHGERDVQRYLQLQRSRT